MFRLTKIINGRINTSEPRRVILGTALAAAVKAGTPVSIVAGVLTPLTASTTVKATHVVEEAAPAGATSVLALDLLPGMVFEAPLSTPDTSGVCKTGAEVKITADGVQPAAVASNVRGAVIYDPPVGATVLVTFPIV